MTPEGPSVPARMLAVTTTADTPPHTASRRASGTSWALLGGSVALFALHCWMGLRMRGPLVFPDEAGMLGHADWFLGSDRLLQMGATSYYYFGYSLFLVPVFAVLDGPGPLYAGAIVTNALLLTALFPLLYLALRRVFGLESVPSLLGAAAGAVYPAVLFAVNHAWAEPAAIPAFTGMVLAAWLLVRPGPPVPRLLFAPVVVLAYATHPRFTLVLVVAAALIGVGWWADRVPRRIALANAVVLVAGFALVRVVNAALFDARWTAGNEVIENSPSALVRYALDPGHWPELAKMATGQAWYLVAASFGLFVLGLVVVVPRAGPALRARRSVFTGASPATLATAFALLAAAGTFASSVVFMSINRSRADHLVYGRYNEAFLPLFVAAGVAFVATRRPARRTLVWLGVSAAVLVALAGVLRLVRNPELFEAQTNWPPVIGIFWQVTEWPVEIFGSLVPEATTVGLVAIAGLALLAWRWPRAAAGAAALVFLGGGLWAYDHLLPREVEHWYGDWRFPDQVEALDVAEAGFDVETTCDFCFWRYQWFLDGTRIDPFDSAAGDEPPDTDVVIAPIDWPEARSLGARLALVDGRNEEGVWVLPGDRLRELEEAGMLLPVGFPAELPADAFSSELDVDRGEIDLESGETRDVEVGITHTGDDAPWVDFDSFGLPGLVRLHAVLRDDLGREVGRTETELPELVYPGESVAVDVPIVARDASGDGLPPGDYTLELGLVQEGYAPFSERGDENRVIPVRVT